MKAKNVYGWFFLALLVSISFAHSAESKDSWRSGTPKLQATTVNGTNFDLAKLRGQWVVVNFWATWCSPCLKELPDFDQLDRARNDISLVGLAFEEIERAEMLAFLKLHPVQYPIVIVDTFDPPKDFETPRGLPTTYLIDPSGKIVERFVGPITSQQISAAVARLSKPATKKSMAGKKK